MGFGTIFERDPTNHLDFDLAVTATTFVVLTWLTLAIRIFVRLRYLKSVAIDDWLIIAAAVGIYHS
jgi:hypothetical protein